MLFALARTKLDVFITGKNLVLNGYQLSKLLPPNEGFNTTQQLRRAPLSVQPNMAAGSSRKSDLERRRFYEIPIGSVIEIDTKL